MFVFGNLKIWKFRIFYLSSSCAEFSNLQHGTGKQFFLEKLKKNFQFFFSERKSKTKLYDRRFKWALQSSRANLIIRKNHRLHTHIEFKIKIKKTSKARTTVNCSILKYFYSSTTRSIFFCFSHKKPLSRHFPVISKTSSCLK